MTRLAQFKPAVIIPAANIIADFTKVGAGSGPYALDEFATTSIIFSINHLVAQDSLFMLFQGDEASELKHVTSNTIDLLTLNSALSGIPSVGEGFTSVEPTGTDEAEATTTDTIIKATGHSVSVEDIFYMLEGGEVNELRRVSAVTADTITLASALSGTPSAGERFGFVTPREFNVSVGIAFDSTFFDNSPVVRVGDLMVMTSGAQANEVRVVLSFGLGSFFTNEGFSGNPSSGDKYSLLSLSSVGGKSSGQSTTRMILESHPVLVGDQIIMTTGDEAGEISIVTAVGSDYFTVGDPFSGVSSVGEEFRVETTPINDNYSILGLYNNTNQTIVISHDGINTHNKLLPAGKRLINLGSNGLKSGEKFIYIKAFSTLPSTGEFIIERIQ